MGRWLLTATAILLGASALAIWILRSPLPPPQVTDYAQLTNDCRPRIICGTDGTRLFVNAFEPGEFAELSTSDGRSSPFPIAFPPDAKYCAPGVAEPPTIRDVSPDGSRLILLCIIAIHEKQVWIVGTVGRPARFLTNAQDAAWSPDGKVDRVLDNRRGNLPHSQRGRRIACRRSGHGSKGRIDDPSWPVLVAEGECDSLHCAADDLGSSRRWRKSPATSGAGKMEAARLLRPLDTRRRFLRIHLWGLALPPIPE